MSGQQITQKLSEEQKKPGPEHREITHLDSAVDGHNPA
mgnify:FL=1